MTTGAVLLDQTAKFRGKGFSDHQVAAQTQATKQNTVTDLMEVCKSVSEGQAMMVGVEKPAACWLLNERLTKG